MKRTFFELSDMGSSDSRRPRSSCEPLGSLKFLESLTRGERVKPPARRPKVKVEPPLPLEDMPWSLKATVVSDRFRAFLEAEAPDHAQFIEAQLIGPKRLLPTQPYFLANWLNLIDCIDFGRSEYEELPPSRGSSGLCYDFDVVMIDAKRVPADLRICRVKHYPVMTIIDSRLAKQIQRAGITGPQFYPILDHLDPKNW